MNNYVYSVNDLNIYYIFSNRVTTTFTVVINFITVIAAACSKC